MSGLLRSLILKSAKIQKKIDDLQRIDSGDWMKLVRLKQIHLKLSGRIRHLVSSMMTPSSQLMPAPVRVTRRHFRSANKT